MRLGFLVRVALPVWLAVFAVLWMAGGDRGTDGFSLPPIAEPPVALQVRPLFMLARGDIRIEVRVARHADNRILAISWDSDGGGSKGETDRKIDGEDGPVLFNVTLPSQLPANYIFLATLIGSNGHPRGQAEARIRVPDGASL